MSSWMDVSINLKTSENTSKADIVNVFHRFSKPFKGSEGGLDVSFITKRIKKEMSKNFNVFENEILTNAIMESVLRDKGEEHYEEMISEFKDFYDVLEKNNLVESAIVLLNCHTSDKYIMIYCKGEHVKVSKVEK